MIRLSAVSMLTGALALCAVQGALVGCASTGIAVREKLGYAKREQLVDRVEEARDGQQAAKAQFADALEELLALTGGTNSDLEAAYKKLKSQADRSKSKAQAVSDRIASVERVAGALFKEWRAELEQYQSATLRTTAERQMTDTQRQYDQLIGAMKAAEAKMDPVLRAFEDQVLFLKHNLNARAIASLKGTQAQIENDVAGLIQELEASIAEADQFISQMGSEAKG